ncbi:MAG: DUF11 domain-containing protein [Pirellulales bacterium]|nr:DUF11 domain-containing protein [Pirellulales bacterium]
MSSSRLHNLRISTIGLLAAALLASVSCKGPMPQNPVGYQGLPPSAESVCPPGQPGMEFAEGEIPLPTQACGPWAPPGIAQPWPEDEYLRDGGDRGSTAGICRNWEVRGVEMEDAVAHYDALDGRTYIVPSNEVYLYSPRFGAVRQVVAVEANQQAQAIRTVERDDHLLSPQLTQKVNTAKQHLQVESEIAALPPHAFLMKQGDGAVSTALGPQGFSDAFKAYEDLAVIRWGKIEMAEMAHLAQGVDAAVAWSHAQAVQIILDGRGPMELVKDEKTHSLMTALPQGNPRLRLIKVASAPAALPGEEIWFTLRFDNVGQQPIGNVTLIDSLNTRLEYVEGSAQCSRQAQFFTEPNEGGSQVLRCEISEPLQPGEGGVVRFRCLVR